MKSDHLIALITALLSATTDDRAGHRHGAFDERTESTLRRLLARIDLDDTLENLK